VRIKRVFNNNAILAYKDSSEVVIFGKGIGFGKKHGDEIDNKKIEKVFVTNENHLSSFKTLFEEVSTEYADLTFRIVKQAESDLNIEFISSTYIAILDHINYALIRAKEDLFVTNPLLWEIKRTYIKEYNAALKTLEIIEEETGIKLPADEAGTIAVHYLNAQDPKMQFSTSYHAVEIIQSIIKIIQFHFQVEFNEEDINYSRLMTHLRYFISGLMTGCRKSAGLDEGFIFNQLKLQYPDVYECVLKIRQFVQSKLDKEVSDEELLYLMLHIQRVIKKVK
jgi:beta-glucoside operon transcriptional antiterminator